MCFWVHFSQEQPHRIQGNARDEEDCRQLAMGAASTKYIELKNAGGLGYPINPKKKKDKVYRTVCKKIQKNIKEDLEKSLGKG